MSPGHQGMSVLGQQTTSRSLFDHLVGLRQQRRRHRDAKLLPERACSKGASFNPRGRPRHGASNCKILGGADIATSAKEGRNAVRSPQTHSQAGPTTTTRTQWCPRRVYPRSNRSEPPETSQVDPNATTKSALRAGQSTIQSAPTPVATGLLQRNRPKTDMPW